KHLARSGWVVGLNVDPKGGDSEFALSGTLVFRGATSKEIRPLSSRILGMMMSGEAKPRIERKEGRPLVVVPSSSSGSSKEGGWVWWPENDDLVIASSFPSAAEAVLGALDGKVPSAVDNPIVQELAKIEGGFDPVCIAFLDPAQGSKATSKLTTFLDQI